ncbi:MAG TPA: alpha/beta hydrolase, partial [Caulobacteraceae bacterium]
FAVVVHDWRGQGLSPRPLDDPMKGHAAGFAQYLDDYHRLLGLYEERMPKPWIAMGHSMGGGLTLLALAHGEAKRFKAAILSAPMLGLQTPGRPKRASRALAWLMARTGRANDYVLGDPGKPFGEPFEVNILTHDAARYARNNAQLEANGDLALGSPTWGWLDFAFSVSAWLKRDPRVAKLDIPVVVLGAAEERLVDNADQREIVTRIPQGRWLEVPGSYHEILQETDDIRAVFWREFDALAASVTSPTA